MKLFLLIIICLITFNVSGSSGTIKQNSIIKCNGKYYGSHGNPAHWHIVEKNGDTWVSVSSEVEIPNCYIEPVNEVEKVKFSKCVDGDTAKFIINNEEKIVRFLAIDTPESVHPEKEVELYSEDASKFTCNILSNAKEIKLEYDGNSDKEDKYGRVLAFVYVDGELLEKKLIEKGYAKVAYIYGDYAHVDELREAEEVAKNKKIGIWSEEVVIGDTAKEDTSNESDEDGISTIINEIFDLVLKLIKKLFALLEN